MNIFDYLKSSVNKHFAKTNYGTEENPNISFNKDRFSCSYLENDNLIISNGIVSGDMSLELKAIYALSQDKTGIANFSHFEKEYINGNESIRLCYKTIDDVVAGRLFKSVQTVFEDGYFSTSKKVSQKLYKLDENNKPISFFVRDTCTNKTNADSLKNFLDVKSSKPLIRTIKTSSQLRNINLSTDVTPENFQSLTNETKVKYSVDDKTILFYKNQENYSQNNHHLNLTDSSSLLKQSNKGKIVFKNDKLSEADGELGLNYLNKKQSQITSDKENFQHLINQYCYPEQLQDVCSLSTNIYLNIDTDYTQEDFLENKFFYTSLDSFSNPVSKYDIHSSLLETISNFSETINVLEKPIDPNEIEDDKDFNSCSDF